ncbi:MAG: SUMF1/EgtB/PvdO family nonheme iron enzyme [Verrucomicrobiales bacterium]|nr:SUMF1/EgtB/PvdO family nonheme iron enzyme [Verrucomicrobiales bacterium]
MSSPTVLLIVDENEADRMALAQALAGSVNMIQVASTPEEAMGIISNLSHLSAMVGAIPETDGSSLFDFRDHVYKTLGPFVSAFCSRSDMSQFYGRVITGDKLFYKPVEIPVLKEWLAESVGLPPQVQAPVPATSTVPTVPQPQTSSVPVQTHTGPQPTMGEETQAGGIEAYEEDLPVGIQIGDYRLDRIIQRDRDFALYEAEQTSINRKVAIKTLYRKHRRDPVWVQAFVNEASARAKVNHPNVSLVYECVQEQGVNFYTLELVDSPSLADLAAQRTSLSDDTIWGILESCCSALEYFRAHQMQHRLLTPQTILLQNGDQTRIANPVKSIGGILSPEEEVQQMQYLGAALKPFIRKGGTDPSLYSLIDRMGEPRIDGIKTIDGLRKGLNADVQAKTTHLAGAKTPELSDKETNKKALVTGSLIGAILVLGGIAASFFLKKAPEVKEYNTFSKIPAGPFPYQDGAMIDLPEFWMSQHEVTIAQYAEFLEDAESKPTSLEAWKHPDQPEDKTSYRPKNWTDMYDAAMKGKKFLDGPLNPNCPVTGVDWWDAFTYARWKNARLPSEKEWEKAARGRAGEIYPWGNELDYSKFNSGIDQKDKDDQKAGSVDGYQFWSSVDDLTLDMSRYGVTGMAGNVTEWTNTWDSHPDNPDMMVPIKRGASFATSENFESTSRRAAEEAGERNFYTGFRIVSDVEPGTDPDYSPPEPERLTNMTSAPPVTGGSKGKGGKASGKGKGAAPPAPAPAAPSDWDPADGKDPFSTIFATPAKG